VLARDEPVIAGDISNFQRCSDWAPQISFTTIEEILDWWRRRLGDFPFVAGSKSQSEVRLC